MRIIEDILMGESNYSVEVKTGEIPLFDYENGDDYIISLLKHYMQKLKTVVLVAESQL